MNYRFIFCFLITVNTNYSQENNFKKNLISNMLNAIDSHNQIAFEMFRSERNKNGEFIEGKFSAKLQSNPYKIYAKMEIVFILLFESFSLNTSGLNKEGLLLISRVVLGIGSQGINIISFLSIFQA